MATTPAASPAKGTPANPKPKAPAPKPKAPTTPAATVPAEYILEDSVLVPLDRVEFDMDATQGQIRKIDPKHLEDVRKSLMEAAPTMPLQAWLVSTDHTSM